MGDLAWNHRGKFGFPLKALRLHAVILGSSGSGKTETIQRTAYGAHKTYRLQVVYLDAKGETKREEEQGQDNAAKFVATMKAAGADKIAVYPSLHYNGWQGTPTELRNRLLSIIDYSESAFYGDVAANAVELALSAPTTPRSSSHFLANLRYDRLKAIYQNDNLQYQRVLNLDKKLLRQVEMRYQVFFTSMAGTLDGTLDYDGLDAAYLRVRGFTLQKEAPPLGRFLVQDFIHYISERKAPNIQTLFIIDEFNALRMREETSILFEQARSFGGCLIISAQGYTGLGPREYAERILDACSTYILHACSDPGPVSRRAGKALRFDTNWSEDDEGNTRRSILPRWDWRVPETAVIQQEVGQAYWIYRGRAQHVQIAQAPITTIQIREAWKEIKRQEDQQHQLSELEKQRRYEQWQAKQQEAKQEKEPTSSQTSSQPNSNGATQSNQTDKKKQKNQPKKSKSQAAPSPAVKPPPTIPIPDPDDDEPDRL